MAKRCDHCIFFEPTVFIGETPSGYGLWEGYCCIQLERDIMSSKHVRNLYYACEYFVEGNPWIKDRKKLIEERKKALEKLKQTLKS